MHEVVQSGEHYRGSKSVKEGVIDHGTIFWVEGPRRVPKKKASPEEYDNLEEMMAIIVRQIAHNPNTRMIHLHNGGNAFCSS